MQAQLLMQAAMARLEAERQEALAVLNLYINTPVGVPDHPNIMECIMTSIERISKAEGTMQTLNLLIESANPPGETDG